MAFFGRLWAKGKARQSRDQPTIQGWPVSTFGQLIDRIQRSHDKLQRKVEARTQALHNALDEVRQSEALLRTLFDHSPLGFTLFDRDCRLIRVNKAFCRMLGFSEEELLGRSCLDMTHPEDQEGSRLYFRQLLERKIQEYTLEKRYLRRDGQIIWVKLTAARISDDRLGAEHVAAVIEDITAQVAHEQQQKQRLIEQRNALVREVNHRIKNNIQQTVGLLLRRLGPLAAADRELKTIADEIALQLECIASVHGLQARSAENRCSLRGMFDDILGLARNRLQNEAPQITLDSRLEFSGDYFLAEGEAAPLALIINELLTNAIKHCRRDRGCIGFWARGGVDTLVIRVENERETTSDIVRGTGLELVYALLPAKGAGLDVIVHGSKVVVDFKIASPVIKPC